MPPADPPPYILACKACRALKVRCLRTGPESDPCQRCARIKHPCVPQPASRRGRPPKIVTEARRASVNALAAEQLQLKTEPGPSSSSSSYLRDLRGYGAAAARGGVGGGGGGGAPLSSGSKRRDDDVNHDVPAHGLIALSEGAHRSASASGSVSSGGGNSVGSSSVPMPGSASVHVSAGLGGGLPLGMGVPQARLPRAMGSALYPVPPARTEPAGTPSTAMDLDMDTPIDGHHDPEGETSSEPHHRARIRMADYLDRSDRFTLEGHSDAGDFSVYPPMAARSGAVTGMARGYRVHHGLFGGVGGAGASGSSGRAARERNERFQLEDPVHLGIVSLVEAQNLVQLFHQTLNPQIALLEPQLHTTDYLRRRSSVLFTAVLAASSKFYQKGVYSTLLSHANTIASRALWAAGEDTPLVQAVLILVYWKLPTDTGAWGKIGWAVRMGLQFRWDEGRQRPLPSDRTQALEVLVSDSGVVFIADAQDEERTWICLYLFDRGYSHTFNLPPTMQPHHVGDAAAWATDHPGYYNPADLHLSCVIESMNLREHWELFVRQTHSTPTSAYQHMVQADFESRAKTLLDKWFGPNKPAGFNAHDDLRTKWVMLELVVATKRYALRSSHNVNLDVHAFLLVVADIVGIIENLADSGILRILQDLASTSATVMCLYLKKMFPTFSRSQQGVVASLLMRVLAAYEKASAGETNVPTAFVVRFIRRVLAHLGAVFEAATGHSHSAKTDIGTPMAVLSLPRTSVATPALPSSTAPTLTPAATSTQTAGDTATLDALLAELGAFANPAPEFDFTALDDQFWATLFPADTITTSQELLGGGSSVKGLGLGGGDMDADGDVSVGDIVADLGFGAGTPSAMGFGGMGSVGGMGGMGMASSSASAAAVGSMSTSASFSLGSLAGIGVSTPGSTAHAATGSSTGTSFGMGGTGTLGWARSSLDSTASAAASASASASTSTPAGATTVGHMTGLPGAWSVPAVPAARNGSVNGASVARGPAVGNPTTNAEGSNSVAVNNAQPAIAYRWTHRVL